ncbi:MAG: GNAT family N-acetyltransferase [Chloroflexi bacterium]|nr:GNAT family N-acetyltransferase [Chloroflexota bacterium]
MIEDNTDLPRDLGDGLILRWATVDDVEALAEFNLRIHTDDPNEPELFLKHWTRELMQGQHPTTNANDFTVVVDENEGGKIVSSMNLISQRWAYDGVDFGVGRPELVGTDENYRRRGLVRAQFEAIHAISAARGELVQAITGIPWYYRQFGYEMGVDLGGSRNYYLLPSRLKKSQEKTDEPFKIRPAEVTDIQVLRELYARFCADSLLSRVRDETLWQWELFQSNRDTPYARQVHMITSADDPAIIGYIEYNRWRTTCYLREIAVQPGHSLRAVALFALRYLERLAGEGNEQDNIPLERISLELGSDHPVYEALVWELEKQNLPYGWFLRVLDVPAFLQHIKSVLERRLAESVMAGHTGKTRLNFYRSFWELVWENGRLSHITPYQPKSFQDGDAYFPELTFLQLLFGHRSLKELRHSFVDCRVRNGDTAVLLNILFPKRPSWVIPLG